MSENGRRPVLVTTAHRGVFFGYAIDTKGSTIELHEARNCVYWSADVKGFMGLAHSGPSGDCKVGPQATVELRDITSVGSGDGSGSGDGYGVDVERCVPSTVRVTARHLKLHEACEDSIRIFQETFPKGAEFPRDIDTARAAGLDLGWARQHLGLLMPITEEIPERVA